MKKFAAKLDPIDGEMFVTFGATTYYQGCNGIKSGLHLEVVWRKHSGPMYLQIFNPITAGIRDHLLAPAAIEL